MDNFVTLTLDKYNELYDKANNYDNLISRISQKVSDVISNTINTSEEEKTQKYEFKVGDKVKVKELTDGYGIIDSIDLVNNQAHIKFSMESFYFDTDYSLDDIEKVDESEDK